MRSCGRICGETEEGESVAILNRGRDGTDSGKERGL